MEGLYRLSQKQINYNSLETCLKSGQFFEEFLILNKPTSGNMYNNSFVMNYSGTGSGIGTTNSSPQHPGVIGLSTGSTNSGYTSLLQHTLLNIGNISYVFEALIKIEGLSTNLETYQVRVGMSGLDIFDFNLLAFYYSDIGSTPNWYLKNITNTSTIFNVDSGVAVTTDWTKLKIIIYTDDTIEFYINDNLVGEKYNFTTSVIFFLGSMIKINKTVGTGNSILSIDYAYGKYEYYTIPSRV